MTNVTTLMALAVISLVASIGFASAETVGDGSSEVHVYIHDPTDIDFNVTVVEGGSVVVHNESQRVIDIQHTGTIGSDKSGTFSSLISSYGGSAHFNFPVTNCSSCYFAGTYYFKDGISGETGTITIIHPDGWIDPVQEEVGISETVVVVLGNNSTSIIPAPIEPEPTGKYNVATWTGTYDMVSLQEQLVEVSAKFNQAVDNLGHEKNKSSILESKVAGLEDEKVIHQDKIIDQGKLIDELKLELSTQNIDVQQIANMTSSVTTLENKVIKLEQEKAELTIEKEKWKTLSDNWYAVALEQLRVMVNVLGL